MDNMSAPCSKIKLDYKKHAKFNYGCLVWHENRLSICSVHYIKAEAKDCNQCVYIGGINDRD